MAMPRWHLVHASGGKRMEHTVEKLSGNKVKISFKAPAADFEGLEQVFLIADYQS